MGWVSLSGSGRDTSITAGVGGTAWGWGSSTLMSSTDAVGFGRFLGVGANRVPLTRLGCGREDTLAGAGLRRGGPPSGGFSSPSRGAGGGILELSSTPAEGAPRPGRGRALPR